MPVLPYACAYFCCIYLPPQAYDGISLDQHGWGASVGGLKRAKAGYFRTLTDPFFTPLDRCRMRRCWGRMLVMMIRVTHLIFF
jgi:hypothetical protein